MDSSRPLPPSSQPSTQSGQFTSNTTSTSTSLTTALAQILSNVQNQSHAKLQSLLSQHPPLSTQSMASVPGSRLAQTGSSSLLPQHILTPQSSGTSPQHAQHGDGSMQAIAQLQHALGSTPTRIPPGQSQHHLLASSPPHTQLTPSMANLMGAQAVALLNGVGSGSLVQQQGLTGRMASTTPLRHALNGGPSQSGPGEGSPLHSGLASVSALAGHPQGVSPVAQVLTHHPPHGDLYSMSGSRKRGRSDSDVDDRAKKFHGLPAGSSGGHSGKLPVSDKLSKGLRHFSWRVCEKVQQKKVTTYNEVADELVREMADSEKAGLGTTEGAVDHKNIRRRVYDALNVLMAMNIISKEKKEIRWIGLPTNSLQECQHLEDQLAQCETRVKEKTTQLNELILQVLAFNHLIKRNREEMVKNGPPPPNSAISLPFIIVHTDKDTYIDCSISTDKSEYVFHFDQPFAIHDDLDVLKKMGMAFGLELGTCSAEDLQRAKALLPKAFETFLTKLAAQGQAQATGSGGGPSSAGPSQVTQVDSPFIERRTISGPLGTPSADVATPTHTSAGLGGTPVPSPIPPTSSMISNSPIVGSGSLGISSPLLGSVAAFSKGSLPSLAGSPLGKMPPSPSMMGSPLAKPLTVLSSPVKTSFAPTATTSPRPGGGGASKVLIQPVSSPGVKRVQAQVLPPALGVLSPLVKQLQTHGSFGNLSPQNILNCLSQADPTLLNLAQSLLSGGTSTATFTSTQPTTTGVVPPDVSPLSAQAQGLPQVPPNQSQPSHLPLSMSSSSGGLLPTVVDIHTPTHSQISMSAATMSLIGQQQQDSSQESSNV